MAVKMPTDISWTWWKKNAPDSLPEDAIIKTQMKWIEANPMTTSIKALQEAKGTDIGAVIKAHVEPYGILIEQLKRYRSVVTKQKDTHKDFLEAIDKLVKIAKGNQADLGTLVNVIKKDGIEATATATAWKKQLDTLFIITDKLRVEALSMTTKIKAADTAGKLEELTGKTRYMQQLTKKNVLAAKKMADAAPPKSAAEFGKLNDKIALAAKALMEQTRENEKALVLKAVAVLGDKEGKALFLRAQPVAVKV
jgi:hypothetical protein